MGRRCPHRRTNHDRQCKVIISIGCRLFIFHSSEIGGWDADSADEDIGAPEARAIPLPVKNCGIVGWRESLADEDIGAPEARAIPLPVKKCGGVGWRVSLADEGIGAP
jgi:hypothetical protein